MVTAKNAGLVIGNCSWRAETRMGYGQPRVQRVIVLDHCVGGLLGLCLIKVSSPSGRIASVIQRPRLRSAAQQGGISSDAALFRSVEAGVHETR